MSSENTGRDKIKDIEGKIIEMDERVRQLELKDQASTLAIQLLTELYNQVKENNAVLKYKLIHQHSVIKVTNSLIDELDKKIDDFGETVYGLKKAIDNIDESKPEVTI
jgi:hypothetical protein